MADRDGLQILDIRHPALPQPVGDMVPMPSPPYFTAATEDYLYVVSRQKGELLVMDVRDPARPELVNHVATAGIVNGMRLANGYLLLADASAGIVLLDLSDPAAPLILGNATVRGHANGAFVQNGLLYAATSLGLDVQKVPPQ